MTQAYRCDETDQENQNYSKFSRGAIFCEGVFDARLIRVAPAQRSAAMTVLFLHAAKRERDDRPAIALHMAFDAS